MTTLDNTKPRRYKKTAKKILRRMRRFLKMAEAGEPRPSPVSKNLRERRQGILLNAILYGEGNYQEFKDRLADTAWGIREGEYRTQGKVVRDQRALLELARAGKHRPLVDSEDPEERRLGRAVRYYWNTPRHRPFIDELRALVPWWFNARHGCSPGILFDSKALSRAVRRAEPPTKDGFERLQLLGWSWPTIADPRIAKTKQRKNKQ